MGKYCNSIPPSHVSSSNEVLIKFKSDGSVTEAGFQMEYNPIGESFVITSPGFPGNYDNNLDLSWLIQVQMGQTIEINFLYFDLARGGSTCFTDFLVMYDVGYITYMLSTSLMMGIYCGPSIPYSHVSSSNAILIYFQSDPECCTGAGFNMKYNPIGNTKAYFF